MKKLLILLLLAQSCALPPAGTRAESPTPVQAARALLGRILPDHTGRFAFELIPASTGGSDVFEVESRGDLIRIGGNNGVAMASGLNWYLQDRCRCSLSFCGDQLELPEPLPAVGELVRRVSPHKYRYFFNYCAFSYTMAWWDWQQWERMIDWMALQGINMPLAVTGQEAVWRNVCRRFGIPADRVRDFFVGPGYLPFGWMGCIDGWCGPLPESWIDRHQELQQRIVARQRRLGMTPVLQGFTGHVPAAFRQRFPRAGFGRLKGWSTFSPGTHYIDPMDPLFRRVGKAFIEEQTRLYGTDHLYAADTFIEMQPPSKDPAFLAAMGRALYGGMAAADPQALWVMQGWVFINKKEFWQPPQAKALFGAVPDDRLLLLDLWGEQRPVWSRTEAYYGKPWLWCMLHNFGGRVGMYGGLPQVTTQLSRALTSPDRGRLSGIGVTMEGFGHNPAVYDLWAGMSWRRKVPDLDTWFPRFVHRRYGRRNAAALAAWRLLQQTVYRQPSYTGSVICTRPGLPLRRTGMNPPARFDRTKVARAWELLLQAAGELGGRDTYRYDLVHLARENLAALAEVFVKDMYAAFRKKDRRAFALRSGRFLQLIRDLDGLLATRREFLLGRWLADARRWGVTTVEKDLCEFNARTIITLWGQPHSHLHEYAHKQWAGLLKGFYLRRWEIFIARLSASMAGEGMFDGPSFHEEMRAWEYDWTRSHETHPSRPQGDPVATSRRLWEKYGRLCLRSGEPEAMSLTTNRPVSCSAAMTGHPADLANDGRIDNRARHWATDVTTDRDPWWQVDLEQATRVGQVVVLPYWDGRRHYGFTLEVSLDNRAWQVVADRRDNRRPATAKGYTCTFPPMAVRYIRVRFTHNSANTGRHLVEVMAYRE